MRSDFLPFSPPSIGEDEIAEVVAALRSGWITTGPRVGRFEEDFAAEVGAPDALAVSSCTDALQIALAALDVGPGDAVFTPTMTFCASAHVSDHLGATPVFVDSEATTLNMDLEVLEREIGAVLAEGRLTPRVVLPVHYGGQPCDMAGIFDIARRYGLAIVEDAAHALPASRGGIKVGNIDDVGVPRAVAFSFYATKNLTTAEGGMLTASPDLLDEARLWSLHGMSRDAWKRYGKGGSWRYDVVRPGFKCNMTDIDAALGLVQLRRLPEFQVVRRGVAAAYTEAFGSCPMLEAPTTLDDVEHAWHLYPLRLRLERLTIDRAQFIELLAEHNISASVHFIPLHLLSYYRNRYDLRPENFPVASEQFERLISLPLHPYLSDTDVDDVVEAVLEIADTHAQ